MDRSFRSNALTVYSLSAVCDAGAEDTQIHEDSKRGSSITQTWV